VTDAGRAVGVAAARLSRERASFAADTRAEYARIAAAHAKSQQDRHRLSLAAARANAVKLDWSGAYEPPRPRFFGTKAFPAYPLAELVDHIDWTPFFATWELPGRFPAILDDQKFGAAARSLYADARAMLDTIVSKRSFEAAAVVGLFPANSEGDDILVFADERRGEPIAALHTLRQQLVRREGRANVALSD